MGRAPTSKGIDVFEAARLVRVGQLKVESNLGPRGLAMTSKSFSEDEDNTEAIAACREMAAFLCRGEGVPSHTALVLWGATGTGKTHAVCALLNEVLSAGTFGYFLPTTEIPRGDDDALARLADPTQIPLLVVDDLGSEKMTPRAAECLHKIVGGRHWRMAPTAYTTNYSEDNLRKVLEEGATGTGDRLVGRLHECAAWVRVGGPDRRFTVKRPGSP